MVSASVPYGRSEHGSDSRRRTLASLLGLSGAQASERLVAVLSSGDMGRVAHSLPGLTPCVSSSGCRLVTPFNKLVNLSVP